MDKLENVLKLQAEGMSFKNIAKELDSNIKVLQNFMRRKGYKNINGLYIKENLIEITTENTTSTTNNTITTTPKIQEEKIKEVYDGIDRIKAKIEEHKELEKQRQENRITMLEAKTNSLETELENIKAILSSNSSNSSNPINGNNSSRSNLKTFKSDTLVSRSYKVNDKVQEEFKKFCRANSEYNVSDLVTNAFIEYMKNFR